MKRFINESSKFKKNKSREVERQHSNSTSLDYKFYYTLDTTRFSMRVDTSPLFKYFEVPHFA